MYSNHAIIPHRKHPKLSTQKVQLTVVKSDHVEGVHELSLVLVYPLHVSVEHGVRVDSNPVMLHQVLSKQFLVLLQKVSDNESASLHELTFTFQIHKPVNCTLVSKKLQLTRFTSDRVFRTPSSLANLFSFFNSYKSRIHPSPIRSDIASESPGLHSRSHRRGVIPFVLFWNFSGHSS